MEGQSDQLISNAKAQLSYFEAMLEASSRHLVNNPDLAYPECLKMHDDLKSKTSALRLYREA